LGVSVLVIAWLLARSDLWGHWAMSLLGVLAGAFALSSLLVGPEGFGPGFIFVLWGPVVAMVLLVGRWRSRTPGSADVEDT
jgi:CBS-domain-containing membrane protein